MTENADHVIRLRGPWDFEQDGPPDAAGGRSGTLQIPGEWKDTFPGPVPERLVLRRRFGRPTGVGPQDRLELIVESPEGCLREVQLNGRVYEAAAVVTLDVSGQLAARNELQLTLHAPPAAVDVRLEIFHRNR